MYNYIYMRGENRLPTLKKRDAKVWGNKSGERNTTGEVNIYVCRHVYMYICKYIYARRKRRPTLKMRGVGVLGNCAQKERERNEEI